MSDTQENYISWEPQVNHRGTFDIIFTCFITLGICVWSTLHLSVPPRMHDWKQSLGPKLLWMLIALFSSPTLVTAAAGQLRRACELRDKVNDHFGLTYKPWYKRWYEHIRNFRSRFKGSTGKIGAEKDEEQPPSSNTRGSSRQAVKPGLNLPTWRKGRHRWTLVHGFYAQMGGFAFYDGNNELCYLKSEFIEELLKPNDEFILDAFIPDLHEDTILDKSKANGVANLLLSIQLGWFVTSSIGRLAQHLPLTLLEVTTLAHVLCSMSVYAFWWYKPLDIQEPFIISNPCQLEAYQWPLKKDAIADCETKYGQRVARYLGSSYPTFVRVFIPLLANVETWKHINTPNNEDLSVIVIGFTQGIPHLAAWNSTFPTYKQKMLWRIASCVIAGLPLCIFLIGVANRLTKERSNFWNALWLVIIAIWAYAFSPAIVYIFVESLLQLSHLSPATFQTPVWSDYLPHFS